jgi:2-polyprenyl-6-methoxyphenol hydroxylase-like FAD-dependent oxidoreductase
LVGDLVHDARTVEVIMAPTGARRRLTARIIVAADGLGHFSLRHLPQVCETISPTSYIGAGCEMHGDWPAVDGGVIHMAVGKRGHGTLNVAAALAPHFVRQIGGLAAAAHALLGESKLPAIEGLQHASWQGTPSLSRRTHPVHLPRLFVIGDSAGYVEPFTGEGITCAMLAAQQSAPLVDRAIDKWDDSLARQWAHHQQAMAARQRACRLITSAVRRPWLVDAALYTGRTLPWLAAPLVQWFASGPKLLSAAEMSTTWN